MSFISKALIGLSFVVVSGIGVNSVFVNPVYAWASGSPAYRTAAPGERSCGGSGCHNSFLTNSGTARFLISAPLTYTPGQIVSVRVSFSNTTRPRHGFELTAIDAAGVKVGTFRRIDANTQVIPVGDRRGLRAADAGKYIEQTLAGAARTIWTFNWTAPLTATNPITFYASGADCNGNGGASGDYVYTARRRITR